jgi:hypothetical protein
MKVTIKNYLDETYSAIYLIKILNFFILQKEIQVNKENECGILRNQVIPFGNSMQKSNY